MEASLRTKSMTKDDLDKLRELLAKATPGPWEYRPDKYDDWGFIRGPEVERSYGRAKMVVALSRDGPDEKDHSEHRRDGTDPYEANGRLIVAAVNALPSLIGRIDMLEKGLRPFTLAPIGSGKDPPEPFPSDDTQVAFIANVTFGDFRTARSILAGQE